MVEDYTPYKGDEFEKANKSKSKIQPKTVKRIRLNLKINAFLIERTLGCTYSSTEH